MSGAILLLLAFVFALAGAAKLLAPEPFRDTLRKLLGPKLAPPLAVAVPVLELALAAWLVSGVAPRQAAGAAVVVLIAFCAVLLRIRRRGLACGCFGEAAESAPASLVRNVLLIALAASVALPAAEPDTPWSMGVSTTIGRLTLVLGGTCLWLCLVALGRQRGMIFSTGGVR